MKNSTNRGEKASELTDWQEPGCIDTLAAACAECGRFDDAVRWQQRVIEMVPEDEREEYQERLELYQAGEPFREE